MGYDRDSTYDDEDVIIVQGVIDGQETITLYIGLDSAKIYRLEMQKNLKLVNH